ncbi:unnamed protein product [Cylindrotheca closterium]|uniref:CRAL/TRIO N-terminal domain-containing protein n=1 Tax=Cylindrotheca closterium TaxID=2856 RepID=A0AAD2CFN7_9STRA|nr:unnamed protein product [Cylindrotheca closterium]
MKSLSPTQEQLCLSLLGCSGTGNHHAPSFTLYEQQLQLQQSIPGILTGVRTQTDAFQHNFAMHQEQSKAVDHLFSSLSKVNEHKDITAAGTIETQNLSLLDFKREVEQSHYPIYELALQQDRSYVEDPAFCLKFLRANKYNVPKAVKQMIDFLRQKAIYFGADKLSHDVTTEDLSTKELEVLLSGQYHIQDATDPNGRAIIYCFNTKFGQCNADSQIRVNFYIWYNILTNLPAVQSKGVTAVYYDLMKPGENLGSLGLNSMRQVVDFMSCLPIHCSETHLCLKEGQTQGNLALQNLFLGLPVTCKEGAHLHYGSDLELQSLVGVHGIPQDTFPVDVFGNIREGLRNVWLHKYMSDASSRYLLENQGDGESSSAATTKATSRPANVVWFNQSEMMSTDGGSSSPASLEQKRKSAVSNTSKDPKPKPKRQRISADTASPSLKNISFKKAIPEDGLNLDAICKAFLTANRTTGEAKDLSRPDADKNTARRANESSPSTNKKEEPPTPVQPTPTAPAVEKIGSMDTIFREVSLSTTETSTSSPTTETSTSSPPTIPQTTINSMYSSQEVPHAQFPSKLDVLFGRGKAIQNHSGNVMFRQFVENFQEEYNRTRRIDRRQVSGDVTQLLIKVKGVRFWQMSRSGGWQEASVDVADLKVGQLLRTFRKQHLQQLEEDQETSEKGETGGSPNNTVYHV